MLNQRYELREREGVGGMAHVYKAKDIVLRRVVAIKVLREDLAEQSNLVEQFLSEARAVAHTSATRTWSRYMMSVVISNATIWF